MSYVIYGYMILELGLWVCKIATKTRFGSHMLIVAFLSCGDQIVCQPLYLLLIFIQVSKHMQWAFICVCDRHFIFYGVLNKLWKAIFLIWQFYFFWTPAKLSYKSFLLEWWLMIVVIWNSQFFICILASNTLRYKWELNYYAFTVYSRNKKICNVLFL